MSDLPRNGVTRAARLARLPVGFAGRTALGSGKRLGGQPAELVAQEIQQRTADQVFRVLGELKGGAMKLGQALSIFEAALPPEIAEPYRATLTRLQESAPPLPARTIHKVLAGGPARHRCRTGRAHRRPRSAALRSLARSADQSGRAHRPICRAPPGALPRHRHPEPRAGAAEDPRVGRRDRLSRRRPAAGARRRRRDHQARDRRRGH